MLSDEGVYYIFFPHIFTVFSFSLISLSTVFFKSCYAIFWLLCDLSSTGFLGPGVLEVLAEHDCQPLVKDRLSEDKEDCNCTRD